MQRGAALADGTSETKHRQRTVVKVWLHASCSQRARVSMYARLAAPVRLSSLVSEARAADRAAYCASGFLRVRALACACAGTLAGARSGLASAARTAARCSGDTAEGSESRAARRCRKASTLTSSVLEGCGVWGSDSGNV
jgi:hypothetical protein